MKKKVILQKKLSLSKEKLNQLNEDQLAHFMGGRMALATNYTSGPGTCSTSISACCSTTQSACC